MVVPGVCHPPPQPLLNRLLNPVRQPAAPQSLHVPTPCREHGKSWDGRGEGTRPAESCSWRSWGAPAGTNIASQPLTAEAVAPLPRACFQVEGALWFAPGPEKSAVAQAQGRAGCVGAGSEGCLEPSEGCLEPAVGTGFLQEVSALQAPRLSLLGPENLSLADSFASDLTLG